MKAFKFFAMIGLLSSLFLTNISAQKCGGSYLNFEFVNVQKDRINEKIAYQMFYLLPVTEGSKFDQESATEFVSGFLFADPPAKKGNFWFSELIEVDQQKAENYIAGYNLENFKTFYEDSFRDHHQKQLRGEFSFGRLTFETREMDWTPMLMKIEAEGFQNLYLVNGFFGGCYSSGNKRLITLKKTQQ